MTPLQWAIALASWLAGFGLAALIERRQEQLMGKILVGETEQWLAASPW